MEHHCLRARWDLGTHHHHSQPQCGVTAFASTSLRFLKNFERIPGEELSLSSAEKKK